MRQVILIPDETGGYVVEVPSLPGCYSQDDTVEEAVENIKDAIQGYIASLKQHGEPIPPEGEKGILVVEVEI